MTNEEKLRRIEVIVDAAIKFDIADVSDMQEIKAILDSESKSTLSL